MMKKIALALLGISLLLGQTLGVEEGKEAHRLTGDEYASYLVKKSKLEMVKMGILSSLELENFEKKGDQIMAGFKKAFEEENEVEITKYQDEFATLLTQWVNLEHQLKKTKENAE